MKKDVKGDFVLDATCKSFKRPEYNGLFDPNLSSFFASPRRRKILIVQKLILPNGKINEKMCSKKVTEMVKTSNPFKGSNLSDIAETSKTKSHTPNKSRNLKSSLKPSNESRLQPVTATEFREMLMKRREFVNNQ